MSVRFRAGRRYPLFTLNRTCGRQLLWSRSAGATATDHGRAISCSVTVIPTTGLIAVGGVPDLGRVESQCAAHPEFVCKIVKPGWMANPAPSSWTHEPRIRAAVIAAPGLGFTFAPAGLSAVKADVQLWAGADDETVPRATNADVVRALLAKPPEFHLVPGAVHYSFLAPCGPLSPPALCSDPPGFDRKAFHARFNRAVVAFFRAHLGRAGTGRRSRS